MIQWAYILVQYTAKLRGMWSDVMDSVQKEFDAAGVDIKVPKDIPTRRGLTNQFNTHVNKAFTPITKPAQEVMSELKTEIASAETALAVPQKVED